MTESEDQKTNQNRLSLVISGFECNPNEITEKLAISPTKVGMKGETYQIGPKDKKIDKVWPYNFWSYLQESETNQFIGELATKFIGEVIAPKVSELKEISKYSMVEFQIVQYYYNGCNPGLVVDKKSIQLLSIAGVSLDVDVYCLGE